MMEGGEGAWRAGLHRLSELIKEPGVCCVCMVPCPEGGGVTVGWGGRAEGKLMKGLEGTS